MDRKIRSETVSISVLSAQLKKLTITNLAEFLLPTLPPLPRHSCPEVTPVLCSISHLTLIAWAGGRMLSPALSLFSGIFSWMLGPKPGVGAQGG